MGWEVCSESEQAKIPGDGFRGCRAWPEIEGGRQQENGVRGAKPPPGELRLADHVLQGARVLRQQLSESSGPCARRPELLVRAFGSKQHDRDHELPAGTRA